MVKTLECSICWQNYFFGGYLGQMALLLIPLVPVSIAVVVKGQGQEVLLTSLCLSLTGAFSDAGILMKYQVCLPLKVSCFLREG